MTNSLKQITTPKPSRHPRCPARFHGVGVDRSPFVPSISFDTSIASSLGSRRPVSGTGWPRPCNWAFLLVLFAAYLLHPAHDLAIEFLLDGEVRQRAVWRGAVPMLLPGRTRDHIPGMNLFDGTSPALHEATTCRHDERLTQRVGVPGRAGSRFERDVRTLRATRSGCLEQWLDTHLAGEPFRRSFARRSGSPSLDVHVFTPLWLDSGSEAGAVDHEPIAHVAAPHACIRVVNLVSLDEFDVRGDSMLPTVVEHLLRLGNPADVGAREALVAVDKGKRVERDAGGGQSNEDHGSEIPQEGQLLVQIVRRAHRIHEEVERAFEGFERARFPGGDESLGAQPSGVFLFVARSAEHSDLGTHGSGEFHRHVAQATQAHDGYTVASLAPELPQRGIRGDARAQERRGSRRVQSFGDAEHVTLIDHHVRRIPAVRPRLPVRLEAVECERDALLAEHLMAGAAFRARPARIDDAADAHEVALAEAGCAGTLGHDSADDLVARHDRKVGGPPIVVHLVHIAVANAAVENLDRDVVGPRISSFDGHAGYRTLGRADAIRRSLLGHGPRKPFSGKSL